MAFRLLFRSALFSYHNALPTENKDFFRRRRNFFHRPPQQPACARGGAEPEVPERTHQRRERQQIHRRAQAHGGQHDQPQLALPYPQGVPQQGRSDQQQKRCVQPMGQPPVPPAAQPHQPQQVIDGPGRRAQGRRGQVCAQLLGDDGPHLSRTGG